MKILIVSSKYLPAIGGLETAVKNIVTELIRAGHAVKIVTNCYSWKLPMHEVIESISVQRCYFTERPPRSRNLWIWFKYGIRLLIAPISFCQLLITIKKFRPDIVHLHYAGAPSLYLLAVKAFFKFPLVVSIHGSDVELYPFKSKYQQYVLRFVFKAAQFITANSQHLLSEAIKMTELDFSQKSAVVSMAFTYLYYDRLPVAYKHCVKYLFCGGRFIKIKGQDVLIEAFARLINEYQYKGDLILAGDGPELENCKKIARDLKIEKRVYFFGPATSEQMAALMKGCEICIVPSCMEAFGIVVLEALYAGKRLVASRVGGIPELMTDNPQQLVLPGDPEALAEKIEETLNGKNHWNSVDPEKIKTRYNWTKVASDYLKIYEMLLKRAA